MASATSDKMAALSHDIEEYCASHRQTEQLLREKKEVRDRLTRTLQEKCNPDWTLVMFGSSVNGFGSNHGDIDLSLQYMSHNQTKDCLPFSERDALSRAEVALKEHCVPGRTRLAADAKVPVLSATDTVTSLAWDLSHVNYTGIQTGPLLRMYSQLDDRVVPLVVVVKQWTGEAGVAQSRDNLPNNYTWSLMVLFYLMAKCQPAVIPCLHTKYPDVAAKIRQVKDIEEDLPRLDFVSINHESLGQLLVGFFEYYARKCSYRQVLSLTKGKEIPKLAVRSRRPRKQWECLLNVEDPMHLHNAAAGVFKHPQFYKMKLAMEDAYKALTGKDGDLKSIFP